MAMQFRRSAIGRWLLILLLAACESTPTVPSTIIRTLHDVPENHPGFSNVLVIGVAGDFQSRESFERGMTDALLSGDRKVTGYHIAVGRRSLVTRDTIDAAIRSRKFDAVMLVREKGQDREVLAPDRPVGPAFDLFSYEYPELNRAASIEPSPAITFVTELYSVAGRKKVWSIESLSFDKTTANELVDEQVAMISLQVKKDRLLRR